MKVPGSLGIQSPGCRNDRGGAKRHPDRLYCAGELTLHWKKIINQFVQEQEKTKQKVNLKQTNLFFFGLTRLVKVDGNLLT